MHAHSTSYGGSQCRPDQAAASGDLGSISLTTERGVRSEEANGGEAGAGAGAWSRTYTKKELADFFGETLKTLDRYLHAARIRTRSISRQRHMVDVDSLYPELRDRFRRELEGRKRAGA